MEPLAALYATIDEIPETFRPLYEERGGQFHIAKINGIKTDADVSRVQRALDAEKQGHSALKTQWGSFFGTKKPEEVQAMLDRIPELEEIANSKNINQDKLNELADQRARGKIAPLERQLNELTGAVAERDKKIAEYEQRETTRNIHDGVRGVASKLKVVDTAMEDVLMYAERAFEINGEGKPVTKDGLNGIQPGLSPEVWMIEMQKAKPHWWPASKGGGAGGGQGFGGASNPWSAENWNVTEQGKLVVADRGKAEQMASQAGVKIGAVRPAAARK